MSSPDRFTDPLYTSVEAARYLDVPGSTFRSWLRGYRVGPVTGAPVLTAVQQVGRGPAIPFIGLAEGLVLAAIRRGGVPLQRIRPALTRLQDEFGIAHALASRKLWTDGAEVLFDYSEQAPDGTAQAVRDLVVVRNGQRVFTEVVNDYLRCVDFGPDGYPRLIRLPAYRVAELVVDPTRGFGQPLFARGGARLEDALSMFRAGEPLDAVAAEYGVPRDQLEDAVRVATRIAA